MTTITAAYEIYLAVLFAFPQTPARQCLINRREIVVGAIESSMRTYPEMPPQLFVAVGFLETHLGCARGEGGNWGAPISPTRRHVAGTPMHAARALWRSYEVCGDWEAATRRFRTGLCRNTIIGTRYGRNAIRFARSIRFQVMASREYEMRISR